MLVNFPCFCCRLWIFFKINLFRKILSGTLSEWQTLWIQIRTDSLSVLIWVKTVCKGHQHTTPGGKEISSCLYCWQCSDGFLWVQNKVNSSLTLLNHWGFHFLIRCILDSFVCFFVVVWTFYKKAFFPKYNFTSGIPSECQTKGIIRRHMSPL